MASAVEIPTDTSASHQQFVDLPEEERKLLQRLFKKLGTYPPKVLAQTLSQINYLGLVKLDNNGYPFLRFSSPQICKCK